MYICDLCSTAFDRPFIRRETAVEDGRVRVDLESICPVCGHPHFQEANLCPRCGEWKQRQDRLCRACRSDLLRRFTEFADGLTAEEEEQLDDWLDGDTITNRSKWK